MPSYAWLLSALKKGVPWFLILHFLISFLRVRVCVRVRACRSHADSPSLSVFCDYVNLILPRGQRSPGLLSTLQCLLSFFGVFWSWRGDTDSLFRTEHSTFTYSQRFEFVLTTPLSLQKEFYLPKTVFLPIHTPPSFSANGWTWAPMVTNSMAAIPLPNEWTKDTFRFHFQFNLIFLTATL